MRAAGQAECFVIVNGPEDGTEFPIVRAPFHVGSDTSCPVQVRLDQDVSDLHALVTVVSDGYRVRSTGRGPVLVNGKRAGTLKSRIVRNGGMVQIGHTLLAVDCSPDGLARRSRGIVSESDLGWAAQEGALSLWRFVRRTASFLLEMLRRLLTSWLAIASILFLLFLFWPAFQQRVMGVVWYVYYSILRAFMSS
ncbi:MAG: FHA domain-containing protein [Candidatus Hydrogenedentes bacterium]|nr:FHA domain-containing protein [Candidatus Hydrogenedentota bacterium]